MSNLDSVTGLDMETFSQILEMDDSPDDRDFSRPLVLGFFEQAWETFDKMDKALSEEKLSELSGLGHFLKGSSATLGFTNIRDSCQVIQQYGNKLTVEGTPELDQAVCLGKIAEALKSVKVDTTELQKQLKEFFRETE